MPCGRVLNPVEAAAHPHLVERGTVRTVHDEFLGEVTVPGFPLASPTRRPCPTPACHDPGRGQPRAVLARCCSAYDDERIAALEAAGVLAAKDR